MGPVYRAPARGCEPVGRGRAPEGGDPAAPAHGRGGLPQVGVRRPDLPVSAVVVQHPVRSGPVQVQAVVGLFRIGDPLQFGRSVYHHVCLYFMSLCTSVSVSLCR